MLLVRGLLRLHLPSYTPRSTAGLAATMKPKRAFRANIAAIRNLQSNGRWGRWMVRIGMLICGFAGWERACRMVKVDRDATESLALHRLSLTSHCPCAAFRWARVNRLCGGALSCLSLHGKPRAAVPPCNNPAASVTLIPAALVEGRPASET